MVAEEWSVLDEEELVNGHEAAELVSTNVRDGRLTTHFASDQGRTLMVVSNGTRAMVVLMGGVGDPGEHAVSPGAAASSDGYVLENGQQDTYEDADTVPLTDAFELVRSIVASGIPSAEASWSIDR
jgi:hypothetical protein